MHLADFDRVVFRNDPATGLRAIFALHSLALGPALGGVRRWHYGSDAEALADVAALARGMSCKNALAGIPFGGGKSVILAPGRDGAAGPARQPLTNAQRVQFGRWIEDLGGDYVAAEDVGMRVADLAGMGQATAHVTGIGRHGVGGNPGPKTALGVFIGIGVVAERLGLPLAGLRVAVQGLGNVGMALCERLHRAGAKLVVADIDASKVRLAERELQATGTSVADVLRTDVDVVAPCALGNAITADLAATMPARAIAGSANNQLASDDVAAILHRRGIRYAPDYVVNAGGVISAGLEYLGGPAAEADAIDQRILQIGMRLAQIFDAAQAADEPEANVADALAQEMLAGGTPVPQALDRAA